jgi:enoyl-CoA hydratase/carnithine racemase
MKEYIEIRYQDGDLDIIFARLDKENALINDMYHAACQALESAQEEKLISVALIGSEKNELIAGNNIGDFANFYKGKNGNSQLGSLIKAIGSFEKPIVAAVPGIGVGIGTDFVAIFKIPTKFTKEPR